MYRVIGGDGREYGPITREVLCEWVNQGRVNAQTLVRHESSSEWQRLGTINELAATAGAAPLLPPIAPRLPGAEKKLVAGLCAVFVGHFGVHKFILGYTNEGLIMLLVTLLSCGVGGIVMWVIGIIEGITYLQKSDEEFVATYITSQKGWF